VRGSGCRGQNPLPQSDLSAPLQFGPEQLAAVAGCPPRIAALTFDHLDPPELVYRPLGAAETAIAISDIENVLRDTPLRVVGTNDSGVWERGWAALAAQLELQQISLRTLRPQYFHADAPCRLFGKLVEQVTPDFEYWVGLCVRFAAFASFLQNRRHVIEFGCGTGINILLLTKLCPGAKLVGCDWATPSQTILAQMARESGEQIEGRRFNMLTAAGDCGTISEDSAVLTVHALEQLGTGWQPFLAFLIAQRAGVYVHVEPLLELYDLSKPLDDLGSRYHRKRNYLQGFLPAIQKLAAERQAEILALRPVLFSGLYHDGYSILAWRLV
jgi:hypothetical protein